MKRIFLKTKAAFALVISGLASALAVTEKSPNTQLQQAYYPKESQTYFVGNDENFDGKVEVEMAFPPTSFTDFAGAYVTFHPGARTAWHSHPGGQHIVVMSGVAITATRDNQVILAKPGEAVWCPPDLDHWHGSSNDEKMKHLVITGSKNGQNVVWKDKVSEPDYQKALLKRDEK